MNLLPGTYSAMLNKARTVIAVAVAIVFSAHAAFAEPMEDCKEYSRMGLPGKQGELLCRKGFLLAYSAELKAPLWVIEFLTADKIQGKLPVNGKYQPDPDLKKGTRAELDDYKNSRYKMEQLAHANHMKWDRQAMEQTFYLSNVFPQVGKGRRPGILNDYEERMLRLVAGRGALYLFTGPIYEEGVMKTIGSNKVAIPTHIFKILYDPYRVEAFALIIPNEELYRANVNHYIATIRDIERKTGLNFLSNLNEQFQDAVKNKKLDALP